MRFTKKDKTKAEREGKEESVEGQRVRGLWADGGGSLKLWIQCGNPLIPGPRSWIGGATAEAAPSLSPLSVKAPP